MSTQAERERAWMRRCLDLAATARGRTSPNPMVGALIVRDGEILAEGVHRAPGQAHAEVDALGKLGGRAPGATMIVNLEPCCHHGRTPPCTDAILRSGIRRVVVGMVDPFPRVSGQGLAILRAAGLEVEEGVLREECRDLNQGFVSAMERGRPAVWLKAGISLDGRIADHQGHSRWITSAEARREAHRLRDAADAVLIGAGTLRADDPSLSTRELPHGRDALPVVLDSTLSIDPGARLLRGTRRPLLVAAEDAPARALPADILRLPRGEGGLDLHALMPALLERGVHHLLVEGGGQVHRSFLRAGLVDRLHLFVAPLVLAGGPGFVAGPGLDLALAPRLRLRENRPVGPDLHLVYEPEA